MAEAAVITIVQVSDIHFSSDYKNINRLEKLVDDIKSNLGNEEKAYLFLTGDIVNKGDEGLYQTVVSKFVFPALEYFQGIVVCPGNHDVERSKCCLNDIDQISQNSKCQHLYLPNGELRTSCPFDHNTLQNYHDFEELVTEPAYSNFYGSVHQFPELTVVSLNTSWLSRQRGEQETDRGKLRIDPPVLVHFIKQLSNSKLKVAIMHHPLDWLTEDNRQEIENLLTKNFDLILFGHMHSPSTVAGEFGGAGNCLLHQSPTVQANDSRGSNAYTYIRVDAKDKRYQLKYRMYSVPQNSFVEGTEFAARGIYYPSQSDKKYWEELHETTASEIIVDFRNRVSSADFSNWLLVNIPSKTKTPLQAVDPSFRKLQFVDGELSKSPKIKLSKAVREVGKQAFFIGPTDSGLSIASYLALRHICSNNSEFQGVPAYINASDISVNRATILGESAKTCPVSLSHRQIESLALNGELIFIIDGLSLTDGEKFNLVMEVLERYFPKCRSLIFCSISGQVKHADGYLKLRLNPVSDTIYEVEELSSSSIRELVGLHFPEKAEVERRQIVENVIQSFKGMDEPIYPSTVVLLLDALKQIPNFKPLNRIRLLDRYVEVLLGRLEVEDVRVGSFNSTDKLTLISYIAGHFVRSGMHFVTTTEWADLIQTYAEEKLLSVPQGLLQEFVSKGILLDDNGNITFRADYLFTYFVAREMHRNVDLRAFILDGERFFSFYLEIAAYGELEGVDNQGLIEQVRLRLQVVEEKVIEEYSRKGIDLDAELSSMFAGDGNDVTLADFNRTAQQLNGLSPSSSPDDNHLDDELNSVDRGRGVSPRSEIRQLEGRWLNTLKTYLRLLKHSDNLAGSEKIAHLKVAFESSELFLKSLAHKRDIISINPAVAIDGVIYFNPMAEIDPERSKSDFRYNAPITMGRLLRDTVSNPKLSPVFRRMVDDKSEPIRYFIRRLLLESSDRQNSSAYVDNLLSSTELVLQTCSLKELKGAFVQESYIEERRTYLSKIVTEVAQNSLLGKMLPMKHLDRLRLVKQLQRNSSESSI